MPDLDYLRSLGVALEEVVHKWGRGEVDTNPPTQLTLWDGLPNKYTYIDPNSPVELFASSSSTADNQVIEILGLDENWDKQSLTVTLQGQVPATIEGKWIRICHAINQGGMNLDGDVYIAEADDYLNGVPNTTSKWKAKIIAKNNRTAMTCFSVPRTRRAFLHSVYGSMAAKTPNPMLTHRHCEMVLQIRPYGGVFLGAGAYELCNETPFFHTLDTPITLQSRTDLQIEIRDIEEDSIVVGGYSLGLAVD